MKEKRKRRRGREVGHKRCMVLAWPLRCDYSGSSVLLGQGGENTFSCSHLSYCVRSLDKGRSPIRSPVISSEVININCQRSPIATRPSITKRDLFMMKLSENKIKLSESTQFQFCKMKLTKAEIFVRQNQLSLFDYFGAKNKRYQIWKTNCQQSAVRYAYPSLKCLAWLIGDPCFHGLPFSPQP